MLNALGSVPADPFYYQLTIATIIGLDEPLALDDIIIGADKSDISKLIQVTERTEPVASPPGNIEPVPTEDSHAAWDGSDYQAEDLITKPDIES